MDPLVDALLSDMTEDQIVKELMNRVAQRQIYDYRPYTYQQEFHRAGQHYPERLFRAGNQLGKCCTAQSMIETPQGKMEMGSLFGSECEVLTYPDREPRRVLNWIRKPAEECFRITMDDGQWFECPARHLILSDCGYVFAEQLFGLPLESEVSRPGTSSERGPSIRDGGGRHYTGTRIGSTSGYPDCYRFYGEPLLLDPGIGPAFSPSIAGVPERNTPWFYGDDLVSICTNILSPGFAPRSSLDAVHRFWGRCVAFLTQVASWSVPRRIPNTGNAPQFSSFGYPPEPFFSRRFRRSFLPLTVDGNKIVRVEPVGVNDLYDMEVEERHNYISAGMVHHNSECGCAEDVFHLTGEYPDWWEGKRFNRPTIGWIVAITNETSRDIVQTKLMGSPFGTGLIPHDKIVDYSYRQCGIHDVLENVLVRHESGGVSHASFKVYEQGRKKFQGTAIDFAHLDEEPDDFGIYTETRMRIVTRNGTMYTTLTPLMGETELMQRFANYIEGTFMITASMDDCPHLEGKVDSVLAGFPSHERDARRYGTPIMGEGRVFAYADTDIITPPVPLPKHWGRICGIDFGIGDKNHPQACAWIAHDRDTDTIYLYDEYKENDRSIVQQCEAIRSRGSWIPVAWPHDGMNKDKSGKLIRDQFTERNVEMLSQSARYKHDKGGPQPVEPIVGEICERIESGRFKVFPHCRKFIDEFRSLHRKNGLIQPVKDDLFKSVTYALMMLRFARTEQVPRIVRQTPAMRAWGNQ